MLTITFIQASRMQGPVLCRPSKNVRHIFKSSSIGSEVIPCRGGPCGRPQPFLGKVIFWLRKYTSET